MFKRLFGETEEEQFEYLKIRVIISLVSIIAAFFVGGAVFALIMLFVWGWNAVKSLFGIVTIGAIFSGNIVLGVVMFVLYIVLGYIIGVFCAALGIGRFIYLLINRLKERA